MWILFHWITHKQLMHSKYGAFWAIKYLWFVNLFAIQITFDWLIDYCDCSCGSGDGAGSLPTRTSAVQSPSPPFHRCPWGDTEPQTAPDCRPSRVWVTNDRGTAAHRYCIIAWKTELYCNELWVFIKRRKVLYKWRPFYPLMAKLRKEKENW